MNFHWPFWRSPKPAHPPIRYIQSRPRELSEAARKRRTAVADVNCALAVYVAVTPPERCKADTEAEFARIRRLRDEGRVG